MSIPTIPTTHASNYVNSRNTLPNGCYWVTTRKVLRKRKHLLVGHWTDNKDGQVMRSDGLTVDHPFYLVKVELGFDNILESPLKSLFSSRNAVRENIAYIPD